jgi:hypothetical protein
MRGLELVLGSPVVNRNRGGVARRRMVHWRAIGRFWDVPGMGPGH